MCNLECNYITCKDLLPLSGTVIATIGTLIAIYSAYKGISKKVKEDRKAKWIEDFRNEISNFISLSMIYQPNRDKSNEEIAKIAKSGNLILLYLNLKNEKHVELQKLISKIIVMFSTEDGRVQLDKFPGMYQKVINMARDIINNEETAIN